MMFSSALTDKDRIEDKDEENDGTDKGIASVSHLSIADDRIFCHFV